ncbi:MAG: 2-octaprenyl-3-methyl-6-methoxy-1,4-benzoquinol hydroxylase [Betaproteobacteria bacterium RIFCSPLOWO2_02_FULL_62_17]|nr:MAG: 2-octaprenyl-3-methyl-6-methoxy-1,4-benzoquinol hydroxylase [Betaproteobacteria bacterium RIFCSPLOWO2_02_FULL_62_17]
MLTLGDRLISEFDLGLRTLCGTPMATRPSPAEGVAEAELDAAARRHAAALMRVNHCGEVCAQALYQGQALASGNEALRKALAKAADEEADHLDWSRRRIEELDGRVSFLNPLWYAGALAIGLVAGRLGDEWNLGFLAETEDQVERHLQGHLDRLGPEDQRTRAVIEAMQRDEAGHAQCARSLGARELPAPVKQVMRGAARVMTGTSQWI